ncbi:MAG: gamma-glutamylcyclotransferase [Rhodobacteraceae bacterium]|nr:MAG: gamma-glutamylcyclotransferase [Paracoccaceae bacterium]
MDDEKGGFWVFGYGSLMWRPGFAFAERRMARAPGFRRRFCLRSIRYRGTPEAPGLVLGLDRDGAAACEGIAYRVAADGASVTLAYLRERELVTYAYEEASAPVDLDDGRRVDALLYVVDPAHAQYAGALTPAEQAAIIARAAGPAGPNLDYFRNTLAHLREIGVHDAELEALSVLVGPA